MLQSMRIKNLHLSTRFIIIFLSLLCSALSLSELVVFKTSLISWETMSLCFFSIVFLLLRKLVDLFYFFLFLDKCAYYYVTWAAHILWYWYLCGEKNERNTNFSSKFLKIFDCLRNLFNYTIHCIKHRYER